MNYARTKLQGVKIAYVAPDVVGVLGILIPEVFLNATLNAMPSNRADEVSVQA